MSVRANIFQNIVDTLTGITPAAGYTVTIKKDQVHRNLVTASRKVAFPVVYIWASDTPIEIRSDQVVTRVLRVSIELIIGGEPTKLPDDLETYVADIYKAMAADTTRGGHAEIHEEPEIQEPSYSQVYQDNADIRMVYNIKYCVSRTDMSI